MELYVIKCGEDYVRVKPDRYAVCGLDKASVFPADRIGTVQAHVRRMRRESRFAAAAIYRLKITATPLDGTPPPADER